MTIEATSEKSVKDPAGHVKLAVSDFGRSSGFYQALFEQLGYEQISDKPTGAAWITREDFGIWVSQGQIPDYPYVHEAPGLHHLCLKADSVEHVDSIHERIVEIGALVLNAPQHYPQYTDDYYAVFFADPDGIKLEVAHY